jgi:hypothetical protein
MAKQIEEVRLSAAEQVTYHLKALTARQMADFMEASRKNDIEAVAKTLAVAITDCPPEWGAPDDPETYMRLPYYGEFADLIEGLVDASGKQRSR